jgi:hypothetical protein
VSDLERGGGPDRREEAVEIVQLEEDPSHPCAGFSSLSDGANRARSRGAGRFRYWSPRDAYAPRFYSPECVEVEFSEVRGSNLPAYPHPYTNRDGVEPHFSPLSHP